MTTWTTAEWLTCRRCGRCLPAWEINVEGAIHHAARKRGSMLLCKDRRSCERARRKAARHG